MQAEVHNAPVTINNAEEFAAKHILHEECSVGTPEVDYSDFCIEAANIINRTLFQYTQKEHLPNIKKIFFDDEMTANGQARTGGGDVLVFSVGESIEDINNFIQKKQKLNNTYPRNNERVKKLQGDKEYLERNIRVLKERRDNASTDKKKQFTETIAEYKERLNSVENKLDRLFEGECEIYSQVTDYESLVIHEYGHTLAAHIRIHKLCTNSIMRDVFYAESIRGQKFKPYGRQKARKVSGYAAENPAELVAESFTAYHNGRFEVLTDEMVAFWDAYLSGGKYSSVKQAVENC